jgi:hypothetical protein
MADLKVETKTTRTFTLRLTELEARVLYRILMHVGGMPEGYRGEADYIFTALMSVGQNVLEPVPETFVVPGSSICFTSHRSCDNP